MLMSARLTKNLLTLAGLYAQATSCAMTTLSKKAHSDSGFFGQLMAGEISFSATKYDQVVSWFARNWPPDLLWPDGIEQPTSQEIAWFERSITKAPRKRSRNPTGERHGKARTHRKTTRTGKKKRASEQRLSDGR